MQQKACWMCERNPEDLDGIDFERSTQCNLRQRSHAEVISLEKSLSESFLLPGFVCDYVDLGVMHIVDLGILQYFLGSIAMELLVCLGGKMVKMNGKMLSHSFSGLFKDLQKRSGCQVLP